MRQNVRTELAEKYPVAVERAKTRRSLAIKLFCYECCGGSRSEAKKCTATDCFLYPFSPAATATASEDGEKSSAAKARWEALSEEEKAERIAKLKAGRGGAAEASDDAVDDTEEDLDDEGDDT